MKVIVSETWPIKEYIETWPIKEYIETWPIKEYIETWPIKEYIETCLNQDFCTGLNLVGLLC